MAENKLSLENSKKWTSAIWMQHFKERLEKMRSKRRDIEMIWDQADEQIKAESFYDNEWVLNVNIPLEKTLREIYMGRTEGKMNFDIIPDGQANVEELQPTKYAMVFMLDGNEKDNFWKENREFRINKSTYGEGITFTGMRSYKDLRYKIKEGKDISGEGDLLNEDNMEEYTHETWFFFPQSIHPRDFYIDDAAYGQNDIQYAQDCIRKEKLSRVELELRYSKNKAFDQVALKRVLSGEGGIDLTPKNENDVSVDQNEYVVYHYYHRILKKYLICIDEKELIYDGRYLYDDGKLPFACAQHYTRNDRFWWEGIPERVAWNKAYQSEIWQDILAGAMMNSGMNIVTGNDDQIGKDWNVWGRGINIWRSTGWAEKIQPVNTTINLGYYTAVLDKLDRQSAVDSWVNPLEQFDPGSDKVGIVEIMEANKSVRNRSVDENYNMFLDDAFTQMLSRIKQFAPALLSEKVMGEDGKELKRIFPQIRIDNYSVEKQGKNQVITESMGKYGYFELKPGVIQGIGVKVVTPSTNSVLPILERQKVSEYMTNMTSLGQFLALDQTGELIGKLKESINVEELLGWMNDAYGYDQNSLKANTEKDKINKEIADKYEKLKTALSLTPTSNATPPMTPQEGTPTVSNIPPQWAPGGANGQTIWASPQSQVGAIPTWSGWVGLKK